MRGRISKYAAKKDDWTIPNDDGNLDVPDELMPLFNKFGNQLRFHTISGKNEVMTVAHMVQAAEDFFNSQIIEGKSYSELVDIAKYKIALRIVAKCNGNMSLAAKTFKSDRKTLYNNLKS